MQIAFNRTGFASHKTNSYLFRSACTYFANLQVFYKLQVFIFAKCTSLEQASDFLTGTFLAEREQ